MDKTEKLTIFSVIWATFKMIFGLCFPIFFFLGLNSKLKKCYRITKDKWFKKAIRKNYILLMISFTVIAFSTITSYNLINGLSDVLRSEHGLMNKIEKIQNIASVNITRKTKDRVSLFKYQIRIRALLILNSISFAFLFSFGLLVYFFHPSKESSFNLKNELIIGNFIRKENIKKSLVFATPKGYLVKLIGSNPKELVGEHANQIWAPLNVKVRSWIEDPKDSTLIFFKKEFELPSVIPYDKQA